jgi:TolB-like protein/Tfp pilus assembly protein PilF
LSLLSELKRRNVIRVSMAYLAGAWLILQVADTVIPWLGPDDAVGRILLVVLIVGYVPVVIATWMFEWTPDGIRFDDEVEVDAAGSVVARRRLDRIIIGILALAVIYFAFDKFLFGDGPAIANKGNRSIAVLPFEDISPDGDQAYLGNGIADELRLELQYLDGLRVAGRTSSNAYAQEDSKTIGEILNVESILEGSVRKEGDRVRITVQLTNAEEGFTIWSESYNRSLDKIFEMQEEIATSVAGSLGVRLGVGGVNAFHGSGTRNIKAYEAYLQARSKDWSWEGLREATPLLKRAVELDPNYAAAWSMLAVRVLATMWEVTPDEVPDIRERAHELALRGVQLDPESATAQSNLALVRMTLHDWIGAEQGHSRATELLMDREVVEGYAIMLMVTGRSAEAQKQFDLAMALEPLDGRPPDLLWHAILAQGRIEATKEIITTWHDKLNSTENILDVAFNEQDPEALKAAIQALPEVDDDYLKLPYIHLYGPVLAEFDSPERVLSILRAVYEDESLQWARKLHDVAMVAVYFGDPEFALEVKRQELLVNTFRLGALWYPVMSEVRRLPEFKDLVTELNLVEYWRAYGWAGACEPLGDNDFTCT